MDPLVDWVAEALAPMGEVTSRRMMGGHTLYLDGTVFAIAALDDLWFKSDATSNPAWDVEGCDPFTYDAKGETRTMNYRRAPSDVHDDADAMRHWAGLALEASRRAPVKKRKAKA
ncbi:TfoX/Sxy family protein [Sphingomonas montanisoli]|uniref:TfoX/Sxy family protein n=2 Tax=Sphingomonas montanisoli TaxID=2606412 RepID=A0A5D9C8H6_9SPHN|nr:TfoX/Sxy family protein [Sphingomonas montanisoli]